MNLDRLRTSTFAAALVGACSLAVATSPARATTGLAYTVTVPVQVTASVIKIKKNEFTKNGVTAYPRGTTVHLRLRNMTKHEIRPQLRVISGLNFVGSSGFSKITKGPKSVAAGKTGNFNVYLFFRGRLRLEAVTGGKVVSWVPINVI